MPYVPSVLIELVWPHRYIGAQSCFWMRNVLWVKGFGLDHLMLCIFRIIRTMLVPCYGLSVA